MHSVFTEFPPDEAARARSAALALRIRARIAAVGGAIGFDEFMARALYAPGRGYYSAGAVHFGANGDFITAPGVSPLFAACLAQAAAGVLDALGGGDLLEFGAGDGKLAAAMLERLCGLGQRPRRYWIIERSPALRIRQQALLHARVPELAACVRWTARLPAGYTGVIFANELLDALPCKRFRITTAGAMELCVAHDGARWHWLERPPQGAFAEALKKLSGDLPEPLPAGYLSELNLQWAPWCARLGRALARGVAYLIDYGYPRREYYLPERHMGTLLCHYRQRAHDDPLLWPGLQDIAAHVDFSAVAGAAERAGLDLLGYTTQAHFLLDTGLLSAADAALRGGGRAGLQTSTAVQTLTHPGGMGERFQVLAIGRGIEHVPGFGVRDLRARL